MVIANEFVIECLRHDPDKLFGGVFGEEVAEVHHRSVVFAAEPRLFYALALTSDVSVVATGNLFACTEVLPKAVFEKTLGQSEFEESSVGS